MSNDHLDGSPIDGHLNEVVIIGDRPNTYTRVGFKDLLVNDDNNCRKHIQATALVTLATDIRKNGLVQPILARYKWPGERFEQPYVLVAGYTRTHAIRDILQKEDPTKWGSIDCIVKDMTPTQVITANLTENLKRTDLNIVEEAEPIRKLMLMGYHSRPQLKELLGVSDGWLQPRLYLLKMSDDIKKVAAEGWLTGDDIRQLYGLQNEEDRKICLRRIKTEREMGAKGRIDLGKASLETRIIEANKARNRSRKEIENLQDYLADICFEPGISTRMLAWCAGHITDMDLLASLQEQMKKEGKFFYPPRTGIPNMAALRKNFYAEQVAPVV